MPIYSAAQYNNAEFAVGNATTDYDVQANQTNLFNVTTSKTGYAAWYVRIITDQTVTIKLNKTTNDAITLTSSMSPFLIDEIVSVSNIFITNNSGNTANIKVFVSKSVDR